VTRAADATEDLEELSLGTTMKTHFPNPDDILNFELTIDPDEGMYKGGRFKFDFKINQNFPHDPPKVKCTQKIYHPNIDLEGNVCLNILREDWKPVLNLNAVVVGLQVCGTGCSVESNGTNECSFFSSNQTLPTR
jgi:ubiquitin-conjugating enzyme E2 M